MQKYPKIIIPILFALAILLGFLQRKNLPDFSFGSKTTITNFSGGDSSLADYYQKSQELSRQKSQTQTATFLAAGDINLSRNVAGTIKKANDPLLPFRAMADILKSVDFNFANLESPISSGSGIVGGHSMIFSAPNSYAQGLIDYNFKILNLANNHALDIGKAGLENTIKVLDGLGIKHTGAAVCHPELVSGSTTPKQDSGSKAGMTSKGCLDQAWQPALVEANGIKICFIGASYASVNDNGKTSNNYVARLEDLPRLKAAIAAARSMCDFVVATMHGGTEYTRTPNDLQTAFAHAAIDDGADVVIGAHPHWVQTIERYCPNSASYSLLPLGEGAPPQGGADEGSLNCPNPKYIFYSLGNFIFDQEWSRETKEGLALKIQVSKNVCHPDRPNASEGAEGSLNAGKLSDLRDSSSSNAVGLGMANQGACLEDLQGQRQPAKLDQIELIPVIIENYSTPRPATPEESKKILDKIGQKSLMLKF